MSAILAVIASDGRPTDDALVARMLGRMGARGGAGNGAGNSTRAGVWREDGVLLAVSRYEWEFGASFSGPVLTVQDGDLVVVADASLYYKDDLRRKLAGKGVVPKGDTASHLILAAYRAFGERCPEQLEGDFTFIIWDRKEHRLLAARDFMGRRSLFYAEVGGTLVVASAIPSILEHPSVSDELHLPAIAESMAGYVSSTEATCYRSVSRLHAARTLVCDAGRPPRITTHWEPPTFQSGSVLSFDDAADQLRALLCDAVEERLSPSGITSVWMSGGRDSTAVFAAGQQMIRQRSSSRQLLPVSISYPPGDAGREDEITQSVAQYWNSEVRWIDITTVQLLDMPLERAATRGEPLAHVFESVFTALAAESRAAGARVALDGVGGDQLFLISSIQLADLFRTGRWGEFRRDWRASGFANSGFKTFFQWAIQPMLATPILLGASRLRRGRPLQAWLRRRVPQWTDPRFAKEHEVAEYDRVLAPRRRGEAVASTESRHYFTDPFFSSIFSLGTECALEHGVEIRSPLYDRRLVEFAATRPNTDHVAGEEGKRLLRHAMRGLLPEEVLASREYRTGTPQSYTFQALRKELEGPFRQQFKSSILAELGVIDAAELERARTKFLGGSGDDLGLSLLLTMHAEHWLQARIDTGENRPRMSHPSSCEQPVQARYQPSLVVSSIEALADSDSLLTQGAA